MPIREVPVCSVCGNDIEDDPMLGDKQGGVFEIRRPGTTWKLTLCPKHLEPLEVYRPHVEVVLPGGTVQGAAVLKYLPRVIDEGPDGKAVSPPTFSGEG